MLQRNVTMIFLSAVFSLICYQKTAHSRYANVLAEAISHISQFYVEPVDDRQLLEGAMQGMVGRLDQYSSYITPEEYAQFQESLGQEFGGVGIVVELNPQTNRLTVLSPIVGTPAYEAGLRAGDVILEIDGEDTTGFSLEDAVRRMRGEPGTDVHLVIQHKGEAATPAFTITRDKIRIESVLGDARNPDGTWTYVLEDHPRIGYVRLTTFGDQTAEDFKQTLDSLRGQVDGLIIDLRGNAGGLLTAAVDVCDMLIDEGTIVSTRGRDARRWKQYSAEPGNTVLDAGMPIALLVDRYSASASEILAACLQDHDRAIVVGQRTWGKGTVQNVLPLEAGTSALKLTTATYWRPNEHNIHRGKNATDEDEWGVRPNKGFDVELPDDEFERLLRHRRNRDTMRSGTDDQPATDGDESAATSENGEPFVDRQLERAVQYLESAIQSHKQAA